MDTKLYIVPLVVLIILGVAAFLLRPDGDAPIRAAIAVAEAMASDTTGYDRATQVRDLVFPDDYGPHPGYKTEWWYYTGNLDTESGRHVGYELTIFRFALAPQDTTHARSSAWAADQLYMAHFALTDVAGEAFYAFERFSRGAMELAGAQASPYRVWLEDWTMEGAADALSMRLRAAQDGVGLDLSLTPTKPIVLHGTQGLDQKGPEPGNASYYYSFTRMETEGTVTVDGATYDVSGLSWTDHEWSTSALGEDLVGWDWFALHLSNDDDLMYYQLRRRDGTRSAYTTGTLVRPDGTTATLAPDDVMLEVLDTWTSPASDATYPARWRLRVPMEDLDLTITPYLADQELDVSVRYWEGAVRIEGTAGGSPVSGNGYVELTGYDEASDATETPQRGRGVGS